MAILFPPTILLLDFKTFTQQKYKHHKKAYQMLSNNLDSTIYDEDSNISCVSKFIIFVKYFFLLRKITLKKNVINVHNFFFFSFLNFKILVFKKKNINAKFFLSIKFLYL